MKKIKSPITLHIISWGIISLIVWVMYDLVGFITNHLIPLFRGDLYIPKEVSKFGYYFLSGIMPLLTVSVVIFMLISFRRFIRNVKKGDIFTMNNIKLLNRFALSIVVFTLVRYLQGILFYNLIKEHVGQSESVDVYSLEPFYFSILFFALFILGISHIFSTGLKLQQEKELTI